MNILLFIMSGVYFAVAVSVFLALVLPERRLIPDKDIDSVSVVIVAKDEEQALPATLDAINMLETGGIEAEVILVDDRSEDSTLEIMKNFKCRFGKVKIISIRKGESALKGKKNGITRAVAQASGKVIFVTDADCIVPKGWLIRGIKTFSESTGMSIGYVEKIKKEIIPMTRTEGAAGTLFAWAFLRLGSPVYCSGGNMAFRKSAFISTGGYTGTIDIASGDDMFLLQKISENFSVGRMLSPETYVLTDETGRGTDRGHQNRRRFSKNFDMRTGQVFLFIFASLYHMYLLVIFLSGRFTILLPILFFKFIIEWMIFGTGVIKMGRSKLIPYFPVFAVYFPVKVIYYSFAGYLKGYRWKSEGNIR